MAAADVGVQSGFSASVPPSPPGPHIRCASTEGERAHASRNLTVAAMTRVWVRPVIVADLVALAVQSLVNLAAFVIALGFVYGASRILAAGFPQGIARDVVAFPSQLGAFIVRAARDPLVPRRAWWCLAVGPAFCIVPIDVVPAPGVTAFIITAGALHVAVTMIPDASRRAACPTDSGLLPRYLRLVE